MARQCAEQGGLRLPLSRHMEQLYGRVGYATDYVARDGDGEDDDKYDGDVHQTTRDPAPELATASVPPLIPLVPSAQAETPVAESEPLDQEQEGAAQPLVPCSSSSLQSGTPAVVSEQEREGEESLTSPESQFFDQTNVSKEEDFLLHSVASQVSSSLINESQSVVDTASQKISPEIQEKVDIFQADKRKAVTSPKLSKKEKKKNKRKQERAEKTTSL